MSAQTAATSTFQITSATPVLMLAMELGEEHWKLGFSSAFGQLPISRVRKIGIVALARKLLIALWRFLKTGVVPEGAQLKADLTLH